jgi:hypothetical protein
MNIATTKKIMLNHLDMRPDKIMYVIVQPSLVKGLWDCLSHYGVEHTKKKVQATRFNLIISMKERNKS